MSKNTKIVIFLYNRLFDPVVQSNIWLYFQSILSDAAPAVRLHVISFEDVRQPLTEAQKALLVNWKAHGLEWTPLKWHPGKSLWQKFKDLVGALLVMSRLRASGWRHVVAFGSVAGSLAYVCALLLRMRLFLHSYEPHSEVSRDSGTWAETSIQFRLAQYFERKSAAFAHVIASGTRFMGERLHQEWGVRAEFFRIPTVVNELKFDYNPEVAARMRSELNLEPDQPVLFYTGKFGGLYYTTEIARAFRVMREYEPRLHLLIVTPNENGYVHSLFEAESVDRETYSICHSSYDDIERFYFVGDLGLITIPPGPGQKFRSSIKVGEYLCAGMPFLTPTGVSEDYLHATEQDVGVVVDDFSEDAIRNAWPEVARYLSEDKLQRRERCRSFGIAYRGFASLNPIFRAAIDALRAK